MLKDFVRGIISLVILAFFIPISFYACWKYWIDNDKQLGTYKSYWNTYWKNVHDVLFGSAWEDL